MIVPVILLFFAAAQEFDATFRAGLIALQRNDLPAARSDLEAAGKIEPGNPRVWAALAQTYFKLHETGKADDAAAKAFELAPRDPIILRGLAIYYSEAGQILKAADMQAGYTAASPQDRNAIFQAIDLYLKAGQPERAITTTKQVQNWETRADLRHILAKLYLANKQPNEAAAEFESAIRLNPYEESYYFEFAQALLNQEQFAQAIEVLKAGKANFDKSAQIELALGVAYYGLRRFDEAADSFLHTIALAPDVEQPYRFLASMLDQIPGKLPEVTKRFADFHKKNPSSYLACLAYAKALNAQASQPQLAEKLLLRAIETNGRQAEPHLELGVLLERERRFTEAAEQLERATALNPRDPVAHYHLSRVYDQVEKRDAAQKEREIHAQLLKLAGSSRSEAIK